MLEDSPAGRAELAEIHAKLEEVAEDDLTVYFNLPEWGTFQHQYEDESNEHLYHGLTKILGSKREASKFLSSLGYVGIIYDGYVDGQCAVIFKDSDVRIVRHERFREANMDTFISNAEGAVRSITMEKATPQQWLKMIESKGGLKAGEDKWIGLSD